MQIKNIYFCFKDGGFFVGKSAIFVINITSDGKRMEQKQIILAM